MDDTERLAYLNTVEYVECNISGVSIKKRRSHLNDIERVEH